MSYQPYSTTSTNSTVKATYVRAAQFTSDLTADGLATKDITLKVRDTDACGNAITQDKDIILDSRKVRFEVEDAVAHVQKTADGYLQVATAENVLSLDSQQDIRLEKDQRNQKDLFFEETGVTSRIEKTEADGDLAVITNDGDIRLRRKAGLADSDNTEIVMTSYDGAANSGPLMKTAQTVDMHITAGEDLHLASTGADQTDLTKNFIVADSRLKIATDMYITGADAAGLKFVPDINDDSDFLTMKNNGDNIEIKTFAGDMELAANGGIVHVQDGNDLYVHQDIVHSEADQFQLRAQQSILLAPDLTDETAVETSKGMIVRVQDSTGAVSATDADNCDIAMMANTDQNMQIGAVAADKEVIVTKNLRLKDEVVNEGTIELVPNVDQAADCTVNTGTRNKLAIGSSGAATTAGIQNADNIQMTTTYGDLQLIPEGKVHAQKSMHVSSTTEGDVNQFIVDTDGADAKVQIDTDDGTNTNTLLMQAGNTTLTTSGDTAANATGNVSLTAGGTATMAATGNAAVTSAEGSSTTVSADAGSASLTLNGTDADEAVLTAAGQMTVSATGVTSDVIVSAGKDLDMDADQNVSVTATNGNMTLEATGAASTALLTATATTTVDAKTVKVHAKDAAGNLTLDADGALVIDAVGASTTTLGATHTETVTGAVTENYNDTQTTTVAAAYQLNAASVDVNATTFVEVTGSGADVEGRGVVIDAAAGHVSMTAQGASSDVVIGADRNISATGADAVTVEATGGQLTMSAGTIVDIDAGSDLTVDAAGTATLQSVGNFAIDATGPTAELRLESSTTTKVFADTEVCVKAPVITFKDQNSESFFEGNVTMRKNLFIDGDLNVGGTTNQLAQTQLFIEDKHIKLASAETGNKFVYYEFQIVDGALQYKRYTHHEQGANTAWVDAADIKINIYEGINYYFKENGATTSWTDANDVVLDGSVVSSSVDGVYTVYNFAEATDSNAADCYKYVYDGETMEFCPWDDKETRDGAQNDGAGLIIEGLLPKGVSFADSSKDLECAEKSLRWHSGPSGVMGWGPSGDILPYDTSSATNGSYWELKGGAFQLTRCIHGHAVVACDGTRSTSNADMTVSYRWEIDDNSSLRLVKIQGFAQDGANLVPSSDREVVAVFGSGFAF